MSHLSVFRSQKHIEYADLEMDQLQLQLKFPTPSNESLSTFERDALALCVSHSPQKTLNSAWVCAACVSSSTQHLAVNIWHFQTRSQTCQVVKMQSIPAEKVIPGTNFTVDGFRHCSSDVQAYFLSHAHSGAPAERRLSWSDLVLSWLDSSFAGACRSLYWHY